MIMGYLTASGSELLSEFSLRRWRAAEFWLALALLALLCWFRLYTHYLAEFALLQLLQIPVLEFSARSYTVPQLPAMMMMMMIA
jgi:hypothetical protein